MIQNPILMGFCPDPSIVRAGEDYYIATSTFEWWPGVRLYHSRDLKHWEQITSPLNRTSQLNMIGNPTSGGVWAPDISYDGERFYLVFTDVKTKKGRYYNNHNYLVWSEDIMGPWSEPVYLNSTGFDPSLFHDTDGKKYLVNMRNGFKGVLVQEYDAVRQKLIGEVRNVFMGTEIGFTEGPHIYHQGDWYYCLTAEGGTGYDHCVTMARSNSIWGPYEVDPQNPMLTSDSGDYTQLQKCGHADLTDTQNGEWFLVHLCSRPVQEKQLSLLGRETAIQKVNWDENGWLRLMSGGRIGGLMTEEPKGIREEEYPKREEKDHFDSMDLDLRYTFPRTPLGDKMSLREHPGWLRLYGQESLNSLHHVSLAVVRQTQHFAVAETCLQFEPRFPEQAAGLAYMYDAVNFYLFVKSIDEHGENVLTIVKSDWNVVTDEIVPVILPKHEKLWLRIQTNETGETAACYYSVDGNTWVDTMAVLSTEILTDEHCRGFTGAHFGMYCHDMTGNSCYGDFDYFLYKNI